MAAAAAAVTAYRKLRSAHQIDAVVVFGSQSARAIVPLTERDGVLSLSITTDSRVLLGSKFAVRIAMGAVTTRGG